jgi:hypothetical protein
MFSAAARAWVEGVTLPCTASAFTSIGCPCAMAASPNGTMNWSRVTGLAEMSQLGYGEDEDAFVMYLAVEDAP